MVIDTSALIAILLAEVDGQQFEDSIKQSRTRLISVASILEAAIVLQNKLGSTGGTALDSFLTRFPCEIVPVDEQQLALARIAVEKYGRGQHPAKLNFGDCFSYALAKSIGEPILFKGTDFSLTDLAIA
jgi:ribonuclease VapC